MINTKSDNNKDYTSVKTGVNLYRTTHHHPTRIQCGKCHMDFSENPSNCTRKKQSENARILSIPVILYFMAGWCISFYGNLLKVTRYQFWVTSKHNWVSVQRRRGRAREREG